MSSFRKIVKKYKPSPQRGFMGAEHTARLLINIDYSESDPFIMLADDRLHKTNSQPVGGPHPHAGFETVSLLLKGDMGDEKYRLKGGDLQLMTAGSGIIHTETITEITDFHLLQLWLVLPKKYRWVSPRVQDLPLEKVPVKRNEYFTIRLYSGKLSGLTSPLENYTPFIIADFELNADASTVQQLPASYTAFLYVLQGSIQVGKNKIELNTEEVGWLDRQNLNEISDLEINAGSSGARFILYAGEPQGDAIISHGPFIGDTEEDISRLYREYRGGIMKHLATLPDKQRIKF